MDHHGGDLGMLGAVVSGILGAIDADKQEKCGDSCLIFSDEQATALSVVGGAIGLGLAGYFMGRNGVGLSASIRTN